MNSEDHTAWLRSGGGGGSEDEGTALRDRED
jgi:hypothetical protein